MQMFSRRSSFDGILIPLLLIFLFSGYDFKVIADSQSFLFTLVNPSGTEPMKLTSKPRAGIRCWSSVGPTFGNKEHYDLIISAAGYLSLGHGFTCPENVNRETFFCGESPFEISELEVFKVNF